VQRGDDDALDLVPLLPDHRPFAEYLAKERIDTVIQCGLVPDRGGLAAAASEADVIATMCVGAAVGHEGVRVRSWVLASSSAVYPIDSHAARFQRERREISHEEGTLGASIAEAEDYAVDTAVRLPHVNVAILRLQELASERVRGPLASLLARRVAPTPIGFDPFVQWLHLDDAASALAFAAQAELAGVYNVASAGAIHWSDAVRLTRRIGVPVAPIGAGPLEAALARLRVPFVPGTLAARLRYGQALDTRKLERAGWRPEHDQRSCLAALRRSTARKYSGPQGR
jgi:UDP-glucose 4-epimerase